MKGAKVEGNELDQILKFHFTQSIFDILILSSFKSLLLFVLINELEQTYLVITTNSKAPTKREAPTASSDQETLINASTSDIDPSNSVVIQNSQHNFRKNILHFFVVFINITCLVYTAVKFAFVLHEILVDKSEKNVPPMHYYHFSALAVELGFCIAQILSACLSWTFMRRLCKLAATQRDEYDPTKTPPAKKVDIKRLISLSYPERFYILVAFLMLIIASTSNIAVPYFFGAVVDSAQKYSDLTEMNKYVFYMFAVFFVGSVAGGVRSWLFEYAGQRVVARLRQQVFNAIITQDIKFFDTNRTGELTSRISSDTQVLQNAVTQNLSILVRYLIQILGSVILMFTLEPSLTGNFLRWRDKI